MVRFTQTELRHISISVLVLAVAVSGLGPWRWLGTEEVARRLAAISIPLAVGFIAHELSHKLVAMRYGYWAVYRMWSFGLLLALLIGIGSNGEMLFAAPGAVVILAPWYTRRESGLIGLAGPLTNIALACCFLPLSYMGGMLAQIGRFGAFINLWLAFFNMLPVPPLDGSKVFFWNPSVWIAIEAPLLVLMFLPY
jgi:Zn-dependent protease